MQNFTKSELLSIGLAISQHTDILRKYPDTYKTAIEKYEALTDKIIAILHEEDRG